MPAESPVLITFARPEESRAFRRRHRFRSSTKDPRLLEGRVGNSRAAILHTGIGSHAAEAAMTVALHHGPWSLVIAAGFAGGLDPALALGDAILEDMGRERRIVSRPWPVETVRAKADLRKETAAAVVDMETETIHRACRVAGISFVAARVISDTASQDLPVPFEAWFNLKTQRPRPLALLAYLARNPGKIVPFSRFVRSLPRLSEALAIAVEGCIGPE